MRMRNEDAVDGNDGNDEPLRTFTIEPAFLHLHTVVQQACLPSSASTTLHIEPHIPLARSVLLVAPSGTGKTAFLRLLSHRHCLHAEWVQRIALSPTRLSAAFASASWRQPSLVVLDDAHLLFPAHSTDIAHRLALTSALLSSMAALSSSAERAVVVATVSPSDLSRLDVAVRAAFAHEFEAALPTGSHRLAILRRMLQPLEPEGGDGGGEQMDWLRDINARCQGMTGADLLALTKRAALHAAAAQRARPSSDDFAVALRSVAPSAVASAVLRLDGADRVRLEDIVGLDDVKRQLMTALQPLLPSSSVVRSPSLLARALRAPAGVLLYGAPGSGKTLLAQALASVEQLSFFSLPTASLLHSHVGESERALHAAFQRALSAAPSVLFIDEIDALFPSAHSGAGRADAASTADRFTSVLASLLSSIAAHRLPVVLLAASNRPQAIAPALLTPHRMSLALYTGLPSEYERSAVVRAMMAGRGVRWEGGERVEDAVSKWMSGLTVADTRFLMANVLSGREKGAAISEATVRQARGHMTPSVSDEMEWELYRWRRQRLRRSPTPLSSIG